MQEFTGLWGHEKVHKVHGCSTGSLLLLTLKSHFPRNNTNMFIIIGKEITLSE